MAWARRQRTAASRALHPAGRIYVDRSARPELESLPGFAAGGGPGANRRRAASGIGRDDRDDDRVSAQQLGRDDDERLAALEGWFDPRVVHVLEALPPNTLTRIALRGLHQVPGLDAAIARHPRARIDQRARFSPPGD